MLKKILVVIFLLLIISVLNIKQCVLPQHEFSLDAVPAAPNYAKAGAWAALPGKKDNADIVPYNSGAENRQESAQVDVFYLYPTSYILARGWNASIDNRLANFIVDNGILPQQASAFNGVAKVYAPRYRQVSLGGQVQEERLEEKEQALDLAYIDVQTAFDFYLQHYNQGRPFLIASHSQGTTHAKPLLRYIFTNYPQVAKRMVAAYIIGNTVIEAELKDTLDICRKPLQTGCYLSWNAILDGGDMGHWHSKGKPICVNPLSWRYDAEFVSAEQNLGAVPIYGLTEPDKNLVGARCDKGILWITEPKGLSYNLVLFPGGGYHAYDYNLFYMNIRSNVAQRVEAFLHFQGRGDAYD